MMALWNDRPEAWHEILPGVKRRILTHGHGVMMVLYRIAPDTTFPMHTHPHVQTGMFLEGGGSFKVGPEVYEVRAGSSYSIPGGVPHELVTDAKTSSVVLDVFVPERDDFRPETLPPERP
jgi:quercetin dioxygenase-like cupin family protein